MQLDTRHSDRYALRVEIDSIRHKALRRFVETGKPKGLDANVAERLRKMIAYLTAIETIEELHAPPNWGAHALTGDRAGTWSLTVSVYAPESE